MEGIHIFMYCYLAFLFLFIVVMEVLNWQELWIFKPYKRPYAPTGITTGQNKSPYSLK